ncbi:DUF4013 domain-containing protein [Halosimplex sp. J119]
MRAEQFGAFGYPLTGAERERPLVACWVLCLLAFLIPVLPAVVVVGYLVRVFETSQDDRPAPDFFADPIDLLRRSLGGVAIGVGYLTVPIAVLLVTAYGALSEGQTTVFGFGETAIVYAGGTAVFCLFLVASYLLPVALASYARERSLRDAFAPSSLKPSAVHAAYFTRWMGGLVALSMTASVANLATSIPRAGPAIASLVVAYGAILSCHAWGNAVGVARERQ